MAVTPQYTVPMRSGSGCSEDDIENEPDWVLTHNHRIGFGNRDDRHPAYTHIGDDWHPEDEREFLAQAKKEADELNKKLGEHELINVRHYMEKQEGWRYVLHTTESFLKYQQDWPVNVRRRQQEEEKNKKNQKQNENHENDNQKPQKESEWRRGRGENETHNEAHATDQQCLDDDREGRGKDQEKGLQDKYSPQELSLLRQQLHKDVERERWQG
ncbi:hypothetical protein N7491_008559 [Penicillium cf. griseofulvum]|uniref:Uncharacterized protein n=1 Tax=Penicillium cf. griseofulvum TaxID=2972120 RepID=A0A9W9MFF7_9EURO|nr:hypothetical protein N7472_005839 [Penicillium cf. griseofulvum]KAJ5423343.1 hypothetical protein N7491_008559 [Penicillium cf. griseofulvum]